MKEKKLLPKRRFKGFIDDWTEKSLDTVLDLLKDGTHGTHRNVEDGIYLLSAKNIKNGRVNIDTTDRKISEDEYKKIHRNFELRSGDILLTVVGSIGEAAVLKKNSEFTFQRSVAYLRPKKEIESDFLYTTVRSNYFQCELKNRQVVSAQPGIYLGSLSEIPIYFPTIKEQKKIGEFFKQLDQMITLEQRKLEKTKALKSAYLAEMFPAEGEHVPKRRFAGFTCEWEVKKLEEIASEIVAGGDIDIDRISTFGKYPVIANALTKGGVVGYYHNEFRIKAPAVTITGRGNVGHAKARDINFTPVVRLLTIKTKHNTLFIENAINTKKFYVESTGVPQLTVPQLAKFEIRFPKTLEEEKLIGEFFKKLDDSITNQQQKLDKLKAMKQAYLQEMFV